MQEETDTVACTGANGRDLLDASGSGEQELHAAIPGADLDPAFAFAQVLIANQFKAQRACEPVDGLVIIGHQIGDGGEGLCGLTHRSNTPTKGT